MCLIFYFFFVVHLVLQFLSSVFSYLLSFVLCFFLMRRPPPRSTRTTHSFPTRRSSDLPPRPRGRRQGPSRGHVLPVRDGGPVHLLASGLHRPDRKSTRLNSSH